MDPESVRRALSEAIKNRDPENVRLLLKEVDINSYIEDGQAPIHLIADYDLDDENCREIFNLITSHPEIDINLPLDTAGNYTILHLGKRASLVKQLLTIDKINVNSTDSKAFMTPLLTNLCKLKPDHVHDQACFEILEICKLLIENGADINWCDSNNSAPIHLLYKLDFNYTQMKDFYNYFTSRPELNVNVRNRDGLSLLNFTDSQEQIMIFLDLPWRPSFLLCPFEFTNKLINEKVYRKWDQIDFVELMDDLMENKRCFKNKDTMEGVWKYLYKNKDKSNDNILKKFFDNVRSYHLYLITMTLKEYEHFIAFYYRYTKGNIIGHKLAHEFFFKFKDCNALRTIVKHVDPDDCWTFTPYDDMFLWVLSDVQQEPSEILKSFKPSRNHNNEDYYKEYFFNLQHIARYYTLPKHLFEHFKEYGTEYEEFRGGLKEIEKVVCKPKSLLEISRNSARKFLVYKYKLTYPKNMDWILKQIGIPRVIQQILMLERAINRDIPLPGCII